MGYLDNFKGQPLITNPTALFNYRKVNKIKNTKEEVVNDRELVKEMKGKLEHNEFIKWYHKHVYQKRKEKVRQQYQDKKALEETLAIETYHELFDDEPSIPTYRDLEKEYVEKARKDYTTKNNKWSFFWWYSRLLSVRFSKVLPWITPIRICENLDMNRLFTRELKSQQELANKIRPYLNELKLEDIVLTKKQGRLNHPNYCSLGRLREVITQNELPENITCELVSAMLRGTYIDELPYLGHNSFLLGDFIATGKGQVLLPALDANIPYLGKENLEKIHKQTKEWLEGNDVKVPLYILRDLHLVRVPASKFQNEDKEDDNNNSYYYYVVPFNGLNNN